MSDLLAKLDFEAASVAIEYAAQENARLIAAMDIVKDLWPVITSIKEFIENEKIDEAQRMWAMFTQDDQMTLWIAPTKGGVFTVEERKALKGE